MTLRSVAAVLQARARRFRTTEAGKTRSGKRGPGRTEAGKRGPEKREGRFADCRWVKVAAVLALLAAAACDAPSRTKGKAPAGRIIAIDDRALAAGGSDTVRFGHLHEGEIAVLPLRIRNDASRPIALIGYERSCGCTTLEYDSQPIMPDSMAAVELRFDARGAWGWQLKLVRLQLLGGGEPFRLYVEADVD